MACKEKCKHVNISGNLEGGCDHCDSFFKSILLIKLWLRINFVFVFVFSPIITKLGRIVVFKFDYDQAFVVMHGNALLMQYQY